MHLCVSSKYLEVYNMACQLVEELLNNLYREYDNYCRRSGRKYQPSLKIKRIEAFGGNQPKMPNVEVKSPETNKENYVNKVKGNLWPSFESSFPERADDVNFLQFGEQNPSKFNDDEIWKILKLRGINVHDDKKSKSKINEFSDKIISPYDDNI